MVAALADFWISRAERGLADRSFDRDCAQYRGRGVRTEALYQSQPSRTHIMNKNSITSQSPTPIPADNPQRPLKIARPDTDESLPHIGLVGDTYTVVLSGNDTDGRFCLIDMHIPPGGGPPPHRHDFEESFTLLVGEIEATFRGEKSTVRAGETLSIPANAPHSFTNATKENVRLLCLCAPAGQEEFFAQVGVAVETRTTPPKLDKEAQAASMKIAKDLMPKYRTEMVKPGPIQVIEKLFS
jgi:quercetin dioxygenase-like cupin family protein